MINVDLYISLLAEESMKEIVWAIVRNGRFSLSTFKEGDTIAKSPSSSSSSNSFIGSMNHIMIRCAENDTHNQTFDEISRIINSLKISHFGYALSTPKAYRMVSGNIEKYKEINHPYRTQP